MLSLVKGLAQHLVGDFCIRTRNLRELSDFLSVNPSFNPGGISDKNLKPCVCFSGLILDFFSWIYHFLCPLLSVLQGLVRTQREGAEHPAPGYPGAGARRDEATWIHPKTRVTPTVHPAPCPWQQPHLDAQEKNIKIGQVSDASLENFAAEGMLLRGDGCRCAEEHPIPNFH